MNNKVLIGLTTLALGATSLAASAGSGRHDRDRHHDRDQAFARVVHVEPLYERVRFVVPVEHCWDERRVRAGYGTDRTGATLLGGAVGAIVGSTIGQGDGRRAATVGGALVGAVIGSELGRDNGYREVRHETVRRCEVRDEVRHEERVAAYRVTWVYNGRREVSRLAYDPGRYLPVAVNVRPRR
jgi:uncharacterized protein YcfJ